MEDIWFATKSKDYVFNVEDVKIRRKVIAPYRVNGKPKDWKETSEGNFRDTFPSNFWDDISIPYWSMPENTAHPTQKSEKLMAKLILASSNPGDMVFDPFMGSGSTAVTAKKLGRNFWSRSNEQYCAWAYKRIEMAESDPSPKVTQTECSERNFAEQKSAKREKTSISKRFFQLKGPLMINGDKVNELVKEVKHLEGKATRQLFKRKSKRFNLTKDGSVYFNDSCFALQ